MKYNTNSGKLDYAIRMGCNAGVYQFIHDYASDMGMTASGALRRLALIGARCESEHGHRTMPASFENLALGIDQSKPKAKSVWRMDDDEDVD